MQKISPCQLTEKTILTDNHHYSCVDTHRHNLELEDRVGQYKNLLVVNKSTQLNHRPNQMLTLPIEHDRVMCPYPLSLMFLNQGLCERLRRFSHQCHPGQR